MGYICNNVTTLKHIIATKNTLYCYKKLKIHKIKIFVFNSQPTNKVISGNLQKLYLPHIHIQHRHIQKLL